MCHIFGCCKWWAGENSLLLCVQRVLHLSDNRTSHFFPRSILILDIRSYQNYHFIGFCSECDSKCFKHLQTAFHQRKSVNCVDVDVLWGTTPGGLPPGRGTRCVLHSSIDGNKQRPCLTFPTLCRWTEDPRPSNLRKSNLCFPNRLENFLNFPIPSNSQIFLPAGAPSSPSHVLPFSHVARLGRAVSELHISAKHQQSCRDAGLVTLFIQLCIF